MHWLVAHCLYPVQALCEPERVAVASFAHSAGAPVGSSYGDGFAYYPVLQFVGESRVENFLAESDHDDSTASLHTSLKSRLKCQKETWNTL